MPLKRLEQNKKELKRIEWQIVKRIMILLHHNAHTKKTIIAMKSGLSYDKCVLYLEWMEMMDMIKRETDENKFELIRLSDKGEDLYERKFKHDETDFMK